MEAYKIIKHDTKNYKLRKFPYFPNKSLYFEKNQAFNLPAAATSQAGHFMVIEDFSPTEIIFCKWTKWNEPDEISFRTESGNIYLVSDENLLKEISDFACLERSRRTKSSNLSRRSALPTAHIHIEDKEHFACYVKPENALILKFLKNYLDDYDIFTPEGEIVKKASTTARRYIIC